ncbi:hypothetical protein N7540_012247 [Penicillium herquei]|nr:hypothetical protein N7540_012247 [Penicillium herquei]
MWGTPILGEDRLTPPFLPPLEISSSKVSNSEAPKDREEANELKSWQFQGNKRIPTRSLQNPNQQWYLEVSVIEFRNGYGLGGAVVNLTVLRPANHIEALPPTVKHAESGRFLAIMPILNVITAINNKFSASMSILINRSGKFAQLTRQYPGFANLPHERDSAEVNADFPLGSS